MTKDVRILCVILAAGLALRVGMLLCLDGSRLEIVDEQHYQGIAQNICETGYFAADGQLVSTRPPLYPYFLSAIYRCFGLNNYQAVRVFQIFVSLLTTLAIFGLCRELKEILPSRGALLAAGFYCFYPSLMFETFLLLTETIFTFWLVLVLWTAVRFFRTKSLLAIGYCGFFIGLGALTRSILWLSPFPFTLFILFYPSGLSWKRRFAGVTALTLIAGFTMIPWMVRNTKIEKTFTAIDCISGRNLMMGNYEFTPTYRAWDAISAQPPEDWYTVMREKFAQEKRSFNSLTQGQKDRAAGEYAKDFILENPGLTLKRDCVKALCFWQLERSIPAGIQRGFWGGSSEFYRTKMVFYIISGIILAAYIFLFCSTIFGIFSFKTEILKQPWFAFFVCVILFFWIIHALIFAHERYHLPLVPILCILSAFFWTNWRENWSRVVGSLRRLLPTCVILGIWVVFWSFELCVVFGIFEGIF